jgi:hypothetical protein
MPDWYVYADGAETGPIGEDDAIALLQTKDPDFVHVWREDFDEWMLLREVPELAAAVRPEAVAPVSTAVDPPKARSAAAVRRREAAKSPVKFAWAQVGAVAGVAICAADLLAWRGEKFAAWDSMAGLAHNFDYVCGTVVLTALLGFIAGAIRDAVSGQRRRAPRRTAHRNAFPKSVPLFAGIDIANINIMARHWRGELPLWVSCWIFGVIGSLIIPFIPAIAVAIFKADRSYNPSSIFSVSAAVWIAVFAIAVWQTVGVWRCAVRYAAAHPPGHDDQTEEAELAPLWSGLSRLVVVVGFASLIATFGTEWLPQLRELYKIAFYDDPDIPAYSIRISRDGAEAEITGGFKYGLTDAFAAATKNARHLRVVHLDSAGGRLGEAEKLFTLIRERGLSTYVSSRCFSACTLAFAGGRERILKRGATLGFHKAEFPGVSENEFDDLQLKVFNAAGFDSRFIERALSTPHKDLWMPPPDVLLAAGVITGVTDGTRASGRLPPESATPSRHVASK